MKTLHLLRHAKSRWDQPGLGDRERGLNKRGLRDAPRMGKALSRLLEPQPIALSPARRAQLTLQGLCQGWPAMASIASRTEDELYTFSSDDVLAWIADQDDACQALFLIGHNPAFTDLVNRLTGEYALDNIPTAGYARLALPVNCWRDINSCTGVLEQTLFPKTLTDD